MSDFQNTSGEILEENTDPSGSSYKPFQILSPVLISVSHGNTIETSLRSKKCHLAKFCKLDACSQGLLFTIKTNFSSLFFFNSRDFKEKSVPSFK